MSIARKTGFLASSSAKPPAVEPPSRDLAALLQGAAPDLHQRCRTLAQRFGPDLAFAVEDLRRGFDRLAQGLVIGVPPEVAGEARLPGVGLDVDALVEAEFGVRAAEAGVLNPAPGALAGAVGEGVVVDPDHPRLDPPGDPGAALAVLGPDGGAEAEFGVVGEVDRLLLGVDDDDRQHRAEDLLAHDPHLVGDAGEDGRGDVAAGLESWRVDRAAAALGRARGDRVLDQLADDPVLLLGGHRADLGLPLDRVAEAQLLRLADDALDEAVGDVAHHVDALDP